MQPRFLSDSIADAAAYILRKYLDSANIDLATLAKLNIEWKKNKDTVNGVFDTSTNAWEALKKVLACGRTQPVRLWDMVTFVRDAPDTTPQLMFDMNSIEQNSLKISHRLTSGETADGVRIFYLDAKDDYEENSVTYWVSNSPRKRIVDIRLPFVTDADQARREAKYKARENMYRRKNRHIYCAHASLAITGGIGSYITPSPCSGGQCSGICGGVLSKPRRGGCARIVRTCGLASR